MHEQDLPYQAHSYGSVRILSITWKQSNIRPQRQGNGGVFRRVVFNENHLVHCRNARQYPKNKDTRHSYR
jgi:hypothetical protein